MDALEFKMGAAKLVSYSPERSMAWRVVFEDEGVVGYCYACDGERATVVDDFDVTVLDAMLVYNVESMRSNEGSEHQRLATIEWSADGLRSVLRLDGVPQVHIDFDKRESFCRSNFPNFLDDGRNGWRSDDHRWNNDAMLQFETAALGVTG